MSGRHFSFCGIAAWIRATETSLSMAEVQLIFVNDQLLIDISAMVAKIASA